MEILIATTSLLVFLAVTVLIATRGRPMRFITAFGDSTRMLWANRSPLAWVAVCAILVLGFLYYFYIPPGTNIGPSQPIAFSHRLHAGHKAIDCYYCHPYVERSIHPGIAPVEKCLHCHQYIIANHPEIKKEHHYWNTRTPTPWVKVFQLAEHVVFNHQRHIKKAIACQSCHGQVRQMDRLKGTRFKMGFCIACHKQKKVNIDCWLACHS